MFSFPDNNFRRQFFLIAFFVLNFCFKSNADNAGKIDSLYTIIKTTNSDTVKVNMHLKIANMLMEEDSVGGIQQIKKAIYILNKIPAGSFTLKAYERAGRIFYGNSMFQKARYYYDLGLAKAGEKNNKVWKVKFFTRIANLMQAQDLSKQCIAYFDSALVIVRGGDEKQLAGILMNKGRAHYDNGDYKPAMDHYIQSQKIFEKNNWKDADYGHLLHFIGSVFKQQNFLKKALEYYEMELALAKEINDRSLEAEGWYLCAAMHGMMGELDKELEYFQNALKLFIEQKNYRMEALMYSNLASNYADRKDYKKAIKSLEKSLELKEAAGENALAGTFRMLGDMYSRTGQNKKAIEYFKRAMDAALKVETKQLLNRADITESMAFAYSRSGDYKNAFDLILEHRKLHDSLNNQSNVEYLHSLEKQYETGKKEKEIALLNADKKIQTEELLRKEAQSKTLIIVCVLGIIVAGVSVIAFINKRKTSRLLGKQVSEINYQNSVIKEKNKDITDSIQYAKRLQEAVFPEVDILNGYFAESFVLFKPKDIVSGDFYWFEQAGDKTVFAVGDCTGHGVPGAFMSILGHNLLNQIILEYGITNPAEILRMLDKQVSNALNKKGTKKEYNDGMDIAICVLDKKKKNLLFAGANRPLVIKRGSELIELKPNKFAIGGIQDDSCKLFTQQEIPAMENDIFYLFSDGYYDQFGGPKGKKFKYRQLVEKIVSIGNKPLEEQKNILAETLKAWQGNLEQVDDVCVVGVKI